MGDLRHATFVERQFQTGKKCFWASLRLVAIHMFCNIVARCILGLRSLYWHLLKLCFSVRSQTIEGYLPAASLCNPIRTTLIYNGECIRKFQAYPAHTVAHWTISYHYTIFRNYLKFAIYSSTKFAWFLSHMPKIRKKIYHSFTISLLFLWDYFLTGINLDKFGNFFQFFSALRCRSTMPVSQLKVGIYNSTSSIFPAIITIFFLLTASMLIFLFGRWVSHIVDWLAKLFRIILKFWSCRWKHYQCSSVPIQILLMILI